LEREASVIILIESKAVRDRRLRLIWDRGGTLKTHVISGKSYILAIRNLGISRSEKILWLP
jgi:hypothetical protein